MSASEAARREQDQPGQKDVAARDGLRNSHVGHVMGLNRRQDYNWRESRLFGYERRSRFRGE